MAKRRTSKKDSLEVAKQDTVLEVAASDEIADIVIETEPEPVEVEVKIPEVIRLGVTDSFDGRISRLSDWVLRCASMVRERAEGRLFELDSVIKLYDDKVLSPGNVSPTSAKLYDDWCGLQASGWSEWEAGLLSAFHDWSLCPVYRNSYPYGMGKFGRAEAWGSDDMLLEFEWMLAVEGNLHRVASAMAVGLAGCTQNEGGPTNKEATAKQIVLVRDEFEREYSRLVGDCFIAELD